MQLHLDAHTLKLERTDTGWRITLDGQTHHLTQVHLEGPWLTFVLAGERYRAQVAADDTHRWVHLHGQTAALTVPPKAGRRRKAANAHGETLTAAMPGVIRAVLVNVGDTVERGQTLVVLEAMKMEIKLAAPHTGTVTAVGAQAGQTVQRGQMLVALTAA